MTAVYENLGVRFAYPENWEIADEDDAQWPRSVSVVSPDGAFWSLTIHAPPATPEDLIDAVLSTMREEYEQFEAEPVEEPVGGVEATGYEMRFYCLDLIVAARLLVLREGLRTFVLLYQAEDHDFDRLEEVFRAIGHSLQWQLA